MINDAAQSRLGDKNDVTERDLVSGEALLPDFATTVHQTLPPRPKLSPSFPSASSLYRPFDISDVLAGLPPDNSLQSWVHLIEAPAFAPLDSWLHVMEELIRHPERNSTNILRADITSKSKYTERNFSGTDEAHWTKEWTISRTILPRRPNLDWNMQQDCSLYVRQSLPHTRADVDSHGSDDNVEEALIVYTPLIGSLSHPRMDVADSPDSAKIGKPPPREAFIPFYHPKVRALAFRYTTLPGTDGNTSPDVHGQLSISIVPFAPQPVAYPATHKLSRVGLSLLTTLHMHTWGHLNSYQKRVHHDRIVPKSIYQDLYLALKTKYAAQLIQGWQEVTDPQKHVFEDLGIAAFLISLWKRMFDDESSSSGLQDSAWRKKIKFVDVGCGNGLLVNILGLEGFRGVGLDLRSRKSWPAYQAAGARLSEWTFEPISLLTPFDSEGGDEDDVWRGAFLVGNHADELTPWIPLLATHHRCTGFINIPCCYYALEGGKNFTLTLKPGPKLDTASDDTRTKATQEITLPSRNQQYLAYIANLTRETGWQVELEALRIPSTKNWAFIGRTPTLPLIPSPQYTALRTQIADKVQSIAPTWTARTAK